MVFREDTAPVTVCMYANSMAAYLKSMGSSNNMLYSMIFQGFTNDYIHIIITFYMHPNLLFPQRNFIILLF